jgi:hypothetical protein
MDRALSDSVAAQLRSAFPEGAFTQVDVLGYGADPDVEPGETSIRAFVDRGGQPSATFEDDETVISGLHPIICSRGKPQVPREEQRWFLNAGPPNFFASH